MQRLNELNTKPFTKAIKYYTEKEFPFNENNKTEQHIKAQKLVELKGNVYREYKYHIQILDDKFVVRYKKQTPEKL